MEERENIVKVREVVLDRDVMNPGSRTFSSQHGGKYVCSSHTMAEFDRYTTLGRWSI